VTSPPRPALQLLLVCAAAGALLVQPFALIVLIGADTGGAVSRPFPGRRSAVLPWALPLG
jgi:hypothetical protein